MVEADSETKDGRTPLWWAAEGGHEAVVKLLLRKGGVNPNAKDDQRKTPLLVAASLLPAMLVTKPYILPM